MSKLKVYLDLDGVTVNWLGPVLKLLNLDENDPKLRAILKSTNDWIPKELVPEIVNVPKVVGKAGYNFWAFLPTFPWSQKLVEICSKYDLYFLSSPSNFPVAAHAKINYVKKTFGNHKVIITEHKYACSGPNKILIDDLELNISKWRDAEGIGYLWPNMWKLLDGDEEVPLEELSILLDELDKRL